MVDETIPSVDGLDPEQLANIRRSLGIDTSDDPADDATAVTFTPPKRKRGRPRKNPLPPTVTNVDETIVSSSEPSRTDIPSLAPAKLSKRDERDVAERLTNMLMGSTGLASQMKPYLQMTEDEAKAVAEPLSSYLVRNADTIGVAQQILENYDLLAITLGVLAYTVRVYRERSIELAEQVIANPKRTTLDRVAEYQNSDNSGQTEGVNGFVSTPYGFGDGPSS